MFVERLSCELLGFLSELSAVIASVAFGSYMKGWVHQGDV